MLSKKKLSKVAANYTLYASHSWDVVSSGVQLALDTSSRAYFGSSADAIPQHLDVVVRHELKGTTGGPSLPEDRAARWPFSLAHLQASWEVAKKANAYYECPLTNGWKPKLTSSLNSARSSAGPVSSMRPALR